MLQFDANFIAFVKAAYKIVVLCNGLYNIAEIFLSDHYVKVVFTFFRE